MFVFNQGHRWRRLLCLDPGYVGAKLAKPCNGQTITQIAVIWGNGEDIF